MGSHGQLMPGPGRRIGKYQIIRELGRGGMGVVYLALDTTLNRKVALKTILGNLAENKAFLHRFLAEAQAVGKLFHPHIVPINALTSEDNMLCIEMPYLQGGSLAVLMDESGLRCREVAHYCADVLDALGACHELNMVHRDVKPSNILLDRNGRALLSDFGLVKVADEQLAGVSSTATATSVFVGTPRYAPLEAWEETEATPAWDLYSVGVILFEGLSGRPLHDVTSPLAYMRALERTSSPRLADVAPGISASMSDLVTSLLARSPEDRASDAYAARKALMETDEYVRIVDPAMPTVVSFRRPPRLRGSSLERTLLRGRRWRRSLMVFALVALVAFAAVLWSYPRTPAFESLAPPDEAAGLPVYTVDQIVSLPRFEASAMSGVFREIAAAGSQDAESWLLVQPGEDDAIRVLAHSARGIAQLDLVPAEGNAFSISGIWGRLGDSPSPVCTEGVLTGAGSWVEPGESFVCNLEYLASRQGLRWTRQTAFKISTKTDTAFLWEIEQDDVLLQLLVNELVPRATAWRTVPEFWLPAVAENQVLARNMDPTSEPIRLDGMLTERVWRPQSGGGITGWPEKDHPELYSAIDGSTLYLAMHSNAPLRNARVEIVIDTAWWQGPDASGPLHAVFSDDAVVKSVQHRGGEWEPSDADWQLASGSDSGPWSAEVSVKLPELASGPMGIFRVNVWVVEEGDSAESNPRLIWGAPDVLDVSHGVLVRRQDPAG